LGLVLLWAELYGEFWVWAHLGFNSWKSQMVKESSQPRGPTAINMWSTQYKPWSLMRSSEWEELGIRWDTSLDSAELTLALKLN